jgi:hypothetical protein
MHVHSVIIEMGGCKVLKILHYKTDVQAPALATHGSEKILSRLLTEAL